MSTLTPPEENGLRAVVAEDETLIRLDLVEVLTGAGYRVVAEAGDGRAAGPVFARVSRESRDRG